MNSDFALCGWLLETPGQTPDSVSGNKGLASSESIPGNKGLASSESVRGTQGFF